LDRRLAGPQSRSGHSGEEENCRDVNTRKKPVIVPVGSFGCETWSLSLREEHRLKVFQNRVLRGIFGPKRKALVGGCMMRSFITYALHQILLG
jgi:hypothetical protein